MESGLLNLAMVDIWLYGRGTAILANNFIAN